MARIKIENLSKEISKDDMKNIQGGFTGSIPTQLGSLNNIAGGTLIQGNPTSLQLDAGPADCSITNIDDDMAGTCVLC
jgi:bacteriocin-like protein